jgi:tetratricopeptide (TPR) repeat protein
MRLKLIFSILCFTFFWSFSALSQFTDREVLKFIEKESDQDLMERNTVFLLSGAFHHANMIMDEFLKKDPENANFNYRRGFATFNSKADPRLAIPFLEKAITNVSRSYDMTSAREKSASVDSYFYLGRSYHKLYELDKARKYYKEFIKKADSKSFLLKDARVLLKQCDVAEQLLAFPKNYEILNLGNAVNSPYPDYSSFVSIDGNALYFTSRRVRSDSSNIRFRDPGANMYKEDVYVSYKDKNGHFQEAQLMPFSTLGRNDATVCVNPDERIAYLYRDEKTGGNIYFSQYENNRFGDITVLDIPGVNTENWEPHFTISSDGRTAFFVSDRPGGYGGRDIYRIVKLPNGEWSKPMNLGPAINTEHDEDSPFLAVDDKTLYFASNGPKSMGGFDIFLTIMDDQGNWSDPINLGYPMNSADDDLYYSTTADGRTGYLTSVRPDSHGEKDIYEVKNDFLGVKNIVVFRGDIQTKSGGRLPEDLSFMLRCSDCASNEPIQIYPRLSDGNFITTVEKGKNYNFDITFKGKPIFNDGFETPNTNEYAEIVRRYIIDLPTREVKEVIEEIAEEVESPNDMVKEAEQITFGQLYYQYNFDYNVTKLDLNNSKINQIFEQLAKDISQGRKNVVITINSSASRVPTTTFVTNENLAKKRAEDAKSLMKSFIDKYNLPQDTKIIVQTVKVDGPAYVVGSAGNTEKYRPYQYVEFKID